MNLELNANSLLVQLGYSQNEASIKQMQAIIDNTNGFEKYSKHILSLVDHIKHTNSIVAMSNSTNHLKIKCEGTSNELLVEFHQIVKDWADKYNIKIEKVNGKEVYYVLGN